MKIRLTKKQLYKIIEEELKELREAYGLGPKRSDSAFSEIPPEDEDEDEDTEEDEWGPRAMQPDANDLDDMHRSAASDRRSAYEAKREEFVMGQYMNWVKALDMGGPEALEDIQEALEEAYDKLSGFEEY